MPFPSCEMNRLFCVVVVPDGSVEVVVVPTNPQVEVPISPAVFP